VSAGADRHRAASVVRRATEVLARSDSSDALPHHLAYLEQLRAAEPPTSLRTELRALWQHLRIATGAPQATPWPIALAALLVCLALFMVPFLPDPSFTYIDPPGSLVAQGLHFFGFLGIAVSLFSFPPAARRRFLRWGLPPNMAAQAIYIVIELPTTDWIVTLADWVLKAAEALGLAACVAILIGCRGRRQLFLVGWFGFSISMVVLAASQAIYAVAFARHGDTWWVISLLLPAVAIPMFAYGAFRYVPAWWEASVSPRSRDGVSC
jgi:hypothetical protein